MTVSDYIVQFLKAVSVRQVFGYPGTPILPFMAALERQSDVEWILMRHENSAAGNGWWRFTDRPLPKPLRFL